VKRFYFLLGIAIAAVPGCVQQSGARGSAGGLAPAVSAGYRPVQGSRLSRSSENRLLLGNGKIKHVVIVFQENRTVDNLFNGLRGANTVRYGSDPAGARIRLRQVSLVAPYDVDHEHRAFETAFDGGKMDGFTLEHSSCEVLKGCGKKYLRPFGVVPRSEVQPYFTMATEYGFADHMFQTNSGPSFPAHQYILSGTSTIDQSSSLRAAENPFTAKQQYTGGCDSPKGSLVTLIDANGAEDQLVYPCFDRPALTDLLDAQSLSWRYYEAHLGGGLWNGPDAIRHIRESSEYSTDVVAPPAQVLTDIANGALANVVWVTPTAQASDHAGITDGSGPSWVASVVNAVGESRYWKSTAIFVTWDDWGGWYDHVTPPQYNSYELGFRVPLIVISPYSKAGYISHRQHEFGSILKFVENAFGLGSLGTTDVRSDDLADCFNFSRRPRTFTPIPSSLRASYFLKQPISTKSPDDE
jgi:phospholipase C